jgi:hypothetical protein
MLNEKQEPEASSVLHSTFNTEHSTFRFSDRQQVAVNGIQLDHQRIPKP